jgi:hypothetical protein
MKDKIVNIAERLHRGFITEDEAKEEFLVLFNVRLCDGLPNKEELERVAKFAFLPSKATHDECVDIYVRGAMYGLSFNHKA